jgi:hypothetical protein
MRASPDHSVDDFMSKVGEMKKRLDAERARKVKDGEQEEEEDD